MKRAFYTGCLNRHGHYFWQDSRSNGMLYGSEILRTFPDFPDAWVTRWDGELLKNGRHTDVYDGKVWSTFAKVTPRVPVAYVDPPPMTMITPWHAFIWWDNSIDKRPGSNSGFYVSGFEWPERDAAFEFAKEQWPDVVARQHFPLILQEAP